MNERKTIVGPLECLVMDRHHYKPINSGYWGLTSVWDMGNVGHDRVACVCVCVQWLCLSLCVCGLWFGVFWERNKTHRKDHSGQRLDFQIWDADRYLDLHAVLWHLHKREQSDTTTRRFTRGDCWENRRRFFFVVADRWFTKTGNYFWMSSMQKKRKVLISLSSGLEVPKSRSNVKELSLLLLLKTFIYLSASNFLQTSTWC